MSEDRIDSIIDLNATQAEVDALEKQVAGIVALIKQVKTAGIGAKESSNTKELTDKTKEISTLNIRLAESHKQVEQLVKARFASEAKLVALQTDYAKATATARTEIQAKNRELKIESELQLSSTGSIGRAEAAVKKLTLERKNLNLFTAEGKKRLEEINVSLDRYTQFIKKNNDAAGKQRLNIGNYQGSAKIVVDALERTRAKIVQVDKAFGEMSPEGRAVRQEFEALERITGNPQFLNISAKIGDAVGETRFFTKALIDLERNGQGSSEAANQLRAQLAKLTDEIADTRAEVNALSSDTRGFDLFAGSVKFLAASWQAAAGAAQLFGGENEDVQKSIQKLVAIQSVAQGVQQVATELTTKGTAANKVYNLVLAQGQILFGKGATAAMRFGVAIKSIAVLAVVAFLVDIANKMGLFGDNTDDATKSTDKLNEALERQQSILDKRISSISQDSKLYIETLKQQGASAADIFEAEQKARRESLEQTQKDEQEIIKEIGLRRKALFESGEGNETTAKFGKAQKDRANAELKVLEEGFEKKSQISIQLQRDIDLAEAENRTRFAEEQRDANEKETEKQKEARLKAAEEAKRILEANARAEFEIFKLAREQRATLDETIFSNENESNSKRLLALNDYALSKAEIINATADFELTNAKLTSKEIELIERQRVDALLRLNLELTDSIKKNQKDFKADTKELAASITGMTKSIETAIAEVNKKNKEATDEFLANKEKIKGAAMALGDEVKGLIFDLFTADIDRQRNAIQDQIDLLDKQKAKDIEVATQSITNAQDRAAAIAVIEARSQAQKDALERKSRELQQQKAKFEKAQNIASIIQGTAVAIVSALKIGPPQGFILAALVGALGAVQIARVLATPIPKFKDGGVHDGGLMIVGDGGKSEGITLPDGSVLRSPSRSTLMDAPAGTVIHPDYNKMMLNATMTTPPTFNVKTVSNDNAIKGIGRDIVKAIKNQRQTILKGEAPYKKIFRQGGNTVTSL